MITASNITEGINRKASKINGVDLDIVSLRTVEGQLAFMVSEGYLEKVEAGHMGMVLAVVMG